MKLSLRANTAAEDAYVRDLEKSGPLASVAAGRARILRPSEYPEPLKRLLAREKKLLRIPVSAGTRRKLEQHSRANGVQVEQMARTLLERQLARKQN